MNQSSSREYSAANHSIGWRLYAVLLAALLPLANMEAARAVTISNTPLYLAPSTPPNVLLTLSNAQNMDENGDPANGIPIGAAIGGSSPYSKSEIAREVIRNLASAYAGQLNLGLMTFKQSTPGSWYLYNSLYDASYNPANYAAPPPYGTKSATTKNYQLPNPADTANSIYYNWASPFYDTGLYPYNFCYSATAKFDNTTNISSKDYYRCFYTKTGTSDGIVSPLPTGNSAKASEQAYGYQGTMFYQGYFVPTDTDYATNTLDFGALIPSIYTSTAWFSAGSPGGGYLQVPVAPLTAAQQTALNNKLTCNVPTAPGIAPNPNPTPTSGPCNSNSSPTGSSILNAGLTAIEGTLQANQLYFSGGTSSAQGFATNTLPNSCNKNFAVLLTNGLPSVTSTGTIPKLSNGQVDICTLTSQAVTAANNLKNSGVNLYVVGYAMLSQVSQNYTALCGNSTNPLDQLASAGGTGTSYAASSPAQLQTALNGVFTSIALSAGSSSALTSNSTSINTNSFIYQASFNSADWSGHVKAIKVTSAGASSTATLDAATLIPAAATRSIYTWDGTAGQTFLWANLTANEQCYLASQASGCTLTAAQITAGQNVLNYLRGDDTLEQKKGGTYRDRSTPLGDIVDSNPLYVSNEDYGFSILPSTEGSTYAAHILSKTSNIPMLYVGANDGMLHGFNAGTMVEVFAYVPSAVYPSLSGLTLPTYNTNHKYFVNGSPGSGDAYYGGNWHTILLGTLGSTSGTNAVFAMDITAPGSMSASKALWEFTDTNDLGSTWGKPSLARFNDGNYYAVINNGYNSVSKRAVLFLVQIDNPSNVVKIDTGVGGGTVDNGLSQPSLLDADKNGTIDAIYAGDLQGDVWKFDVSSSNKSQWKVAYTSGSTKLPLFKARDASGTVQPITAPLKLGSVPSGATGTTLVFFGTGQYLNIADLTNISTQSLYGVMDSSTFSAGAFSGGTSNFTRTTAVSSVNVMVQQSIVFESTSQRAVSTNTVSYSTGKLGWYLDLLKPPTPTYEGERVTSQALLRSGRIVFVTKIPATGTCVSGGSSWFMEINAATGGSPNYTFMDVNGDGKYTASDNLAYAASPVVVGVKIPGGFASTPVSFTNGGSYTTTAGLSSGGVTGGGGGGGGGIPPTLNPDGSPRASWSQIK